MKNLLKVVVCALAIVLIGGGFILYNMLYNVILEAKDVQFFKVEELQGASSLKLKISGHPFYNPRTPTVWNL
jgi:hypothetical protein